MIGLETQGYKGVETLYSAPSMSGGHFLPPADDTYDLGSATFEWKDLYIDGVAYIDELQTDTINEQTSGAGVTIDGLKIENDGTTTDLLGTAGDYLRVGDAGTTGHSLNSEDDLMVTGELEVDGKIYFDGETNFYNILYLAADNAQFLFGAGSDSSMFYDPPDADAKMMKWALPSTSIDANNVPVLLFAHTGTGFRETDLGILDGVTEATIALMNVALDAYVTLDAGDINGSPAGNGLYLKPAGDEDVNILKVGVAENPALIWDDSETEFYFDQKVNALAYAAGGTDGIDESSSGTITTFTITVVKGIVTAFSKLS